MIGRKKKPAQPAQPAKRRAPAARPAPTQEHAATERRIRQPFKPGGETSSRSSSFVFRHRVGNVVIFLVLLILGLTIFRV